MSLNFFSPATKVVWRFFLSFSMARDLWPPMTIASLAKRELYAIWSGNSVVAKLWLPVGRSAARLLSLDRTRPALS